MTYKNAFVMKTVAPLCVALFIMMTAGRCRLHSDFFDGRDGNDIRMSDGDVHEEIKYDGQIRINDNETSIDHISPNGYILFIRNDEKLLIESNDHGELTYDLNDRGRTSSLNDEGKKVLATLVREMIACGFDAEARAERIYKKGGNAALLDEVDRVRGDNVKTIFIKRILDTDSVSENESTRILRTISKGIGSDYEKEKLLSQFDDRILKFPQAAAEYLNAIESLGSDYSKENLMTGLISKQSVSLFRFNQFMDVINHLGSDHAKENLVRQLIEKNLANDDAYDELFNTINHLGSDNSKAGLLHLLIDKKIAATQFDRTNQSISSLGSENDKSQLYKRLIESNDLSDEQWLVMLNAASNFGSDNAKADLFVEIGKKMPDNPAMRSAYMNAAKSIGSDGEYGRVMKAMR